MLFSLQKFTKRYFLPLEMSKKSVIMIVAVKNAAIMFIKRMERADEALSSFVILNV